MYGQNPVTKPFSREDGALLVNSIYHTIQGEGPNAGVPAVFVRLAKCNLRCHFCDTEFDTGGYLSLEDQKEQIVRLAKAKNCRLIVVTGGEPFLQNFKPLINLANSWNIRVDVETAGTLFPDWIPKVFFDYTSSDHGYNKIVCSPKTPALNKDIIPFVYAFKYIICTEGLDEEAEDVRVATQKEGVFMDIINDRQAAVYIQPMDQGDPDKNFRNMQLAAKLCMKHGYNLSLQTHKIVGLE